MASTSEIEINLSSFGESYQYDVGYLLALSKASPSAFGKFAGAQPMGDYRECLSLEAHFIARVVCMQAEDCGACAQLNLRLAVEAGVPRSLLETLLKEPERLPTPLADVRLHVLDVLTGSGADAAAGERLRAELGEAAFAELAICIAGSRIYPTLKRAMLASSSCRLPSLDF